MRAIIFIFTSLIVLNVDARQCGSFGEMRSQVEQVLNQRGGRTANYTGEAGSVQVNFDNGIIMVQGGMCQPQGLVCISRQTVEMSLGCVGGNYSNIYLNIANLGRNQLQLTGRGGLLAKMKFLHAISASSFGEGFFTMEVEPAVTSYKRTQFMIDLSRAQRNYRVKKIKDSLRQPASTRVYNEPTRALDI